MQTKNSLAGSLLRLQLVVLASVKLTLAVRASQLSAGKVIASSMITVPIWEVGLDMTATTKQQVRF